MKRTLLSLTIIAFLASCNSGSDDLKTDKDVIGINNPIRYNDVIIDTAAITSNMFEEQAEEGYTAPVKKQTARRSKPAKQTVRYEQPEPAPIYRETPPAPPTPPVTTESTNTASLPTGTVSNGSTGTETATTTTVPEAPAKPKGWSKAAKGAVIGGVGGAVTGAILSKNKVVGAIIGGVVGAGGGYVIGRKGDKKDGRIEIQ